MIKITLTTYVDLNQTKNDLIIFLQKFYNKSVLKLRASNLKNILL